MFRVRTYKQLVSGNRIAASIAFALLVLYAAGLRAESGATEEPTAVAVPESEPVQVPVESEVTETETEPSAADAVKPSLPPPVNRIQDRAAPATSGVSEKVATQVVVSNGQRIEVGEKGFSITPPEGWEIVHNVGVATVLLQAQKQAGMTYQRSIQVMAFESPRFIDQTTAKEFEEYLVKKFSEVSAAIEDYRIRNNTDIEMSDGRKGILFYSEFKFDGVAMMQAHVLVSSKTRHYLTTYTDIAEHFEQEENQAYLAEAWGAMTSLELDSGTPNRFEGPMFAGIAVFVVSGFIGIFLLMRYRMARKRYEQLAALDLTAENAISAVPTTLNSNIVTLSDADLDEDPSESTGPESRLESGLESRAESRLESGTGNRISGKAS